jgi:alkyl sulfatase BDS1-like metallo-beta-lactamase superfamily hydrolase
VNGVLYPVAPIDRQPLHPRDKRENMRQIINFGISLCAGLTIVTLAAGQDQMKVVRITPSIYMVPAASNVYMVTTPKGNVIIDTSGKRQAEEARNLLRAKSSAPVKYILLTHGHADHIGGIDLWREPGTQIIAQRNYVEFLNYVKRLEGFFAPRNAAAFNRAPEAVGPWAGNYAAKIDPTILFDETYDFKFGGLEFRLFSTPGETPDHMTVWVPAFKAAFIGDNYNGVGIPEPMSFPNLYAIRGTKPRWALDWIHSIDKVLDLKPEIVLNGHGEAILGNQEITKRLKRYRDAIQYVHDETVKGMNAGKDVFTLMQEIKLPASYDLNQVFGKVSWSVRGIYDGYAGWYDMNPASMYESAPSSIYPDLVELAGGPDRVVNLALEKLKANDAVAALHLTDVVLAYDQNNSGALNARISALEYLKERTDNFVEAGWLDYGITKAKAGLQSK